MKSLLNIVFSHSNFQTQKFILQIIVFIFPDKNTTSIREKIKFTSFYFVAEKVQILNISPETELLRQKDRFRFPGVSSRCEQLSCFLYLKSPCVIDCPRSKRELSLRRDSKHSSWHLRAGTSLLSYPHITRSLFLEPQISINWQKSNCTTVIGY